MRIVKLIFLLISVFFGMNSLFAQRHIESSKIVKIEQEGDSIFCREKELLFEVLNFEFDSCNFYNNRFSVTFELVNQTNQTFFLNPNYISWYDTNSLRASGSTMEVLKPDQSIRIKLESIPYSKRRMNSPGSLLLLDNKKEWRIPMRLKQESSKVIHCN